MIRNLKLPKGFTIIEMLVATAILILVLSLALGVMNGTTIMASQTTQRMDATRVARESLDQIGRELSVAAIPWNRYGSGYGSTAYSPQMGSTNTAQLLVDPTNVIPAMSAPYSDSIFWQAPLAHNRDFGRLSLVGYFVIQDTNDPANWRLQLRRLYQEPETSQGAVDPNYNLYTNASGGWNWLSSSLAANFAASSSTNDFLNGEQGWVADGVLGMWVRFMDRQGNLIVLDTLGNKLTPGSQPSSAPSGYYFNSRTAWQPHTASTFDWYNYPQNYSALPSYVQVAIVCVAPGEMGHITALPGSTTAQAIATSTTLATFNSNIQAYVTAFRAANNGVKSVEAYSRTFRIYGSD